MRTAQKFGWSPRLRFLPAARVLEGLCLWVLVSPLAVRTHDLTLFMPLRCSEKLLRQQTWEFIPLAFRGLPGVMLFAPALASSPCPLLYFGDSGILPLQPHPLAFGA